MKTLNNKLSFSILALAMTVITAGCSSEDVVVDIIDNTETNREAEVSYINLAPESLTFYTKSTVYPNSVYDNQHRVVEVMPTNVTNEIQHEWIGGAEETKFAIENSNTGNDRTSITTDLVNNKSYWSIAWQEGQSSTLSVVEKATANQANKYVVRVFTNAELDIQLNQQPTGLPQTEIGTATNSFSIDECADLMVGDHAIDLCQSANFGSSYLVVLDNLTGVYAIAEE